MIFGTRTQSRGAAVLPADRPVAYFCAEYGISDTLPIYSGGLGVLAGDIVQEASERNLPFVAIGLFYKRGYFHQFVDCEGQKETTTDTIPAEVPLELLKGHDGETLLISVPIEERAVNVQVWRFKLANGHSLYLLDSDHWTNSDADRTITDQLYGGDQTKRIAQEIILGVGGARLLEQLGIAPILYHMNEGHSAFLALELLRRARLANPQGSFDDWHAAIRQQLVFTNHTLVAAGNDMFPHDLIRRFLGKYLYESGIEIDRILGLAAHSEKPDHFSVTMFAMRCAALANAVSKLHAKKAREIWPDFNLASVTNGVHLPAWVAPELQELWDSKLPGWRENTADEKVWQPVRKIPNRDLWQVHRELKGRLLDEVYAREGIRLDEDTLTIVWARRFATYKRPDLLFADIERLKKLLFDEQRPIQVIVSGKSHPADAQGKQIIEHIEYLANYQLKHRAVFIDDYSLTLAKYLVAGADVWLNTPLFGWEASGTSGMKASANGVLQCTVPDGWAYEVDWYGLGFQLPTEKTDVKLYEMLEKKVIPAFYRLGSDGVPELWTSMMKETIAAISPRFSSTRMVSEYVSNVYLPNVPVA